MMITIDELRKISKEAEDRIFLESIKNIEESFIKEANEGKYYLCFSVLNKKMGKRLKDYFKQRNFKVKLYDDWSTDLIISWEEK